jgi:hypothetical protein
MFILPQALPEEKSRMDLSSSIKTPNLLHFSHLIDLTPENLILVLCDASSYHDSYKFRPEDVQILKLESFK